MQTITEPWQAGADMSLYEKSFNQDTGQQQHTSNKVNHT